MIPRYLRQGYVANRIGTTDASLSRKLNNKNGQVITGRDKAKIIKVFREIITDLEDRVSVLKGSEG